MIDKFDDKARAAMARKVPDTPAGWAGRGGEYTGYSNAARFMEMHDAAPSFCDDAIMENP